MAPRGGSGALAAPAHGAITPLRVPAPASGPSGGAGGMAALLAAAGSAGGSAAAGPAGPAAATAQAASRARPRASMPAAAPAGSPLDAVLPSAGSGGSALPGSTPDPTHGNSSGPSELSFPYFPAYVLDNNDGVVLFPGVTQYALPGTYADLEAQVSGTTVSSYNWNTSGLSGRDQYLGRQHLPAHLEMAYRRADGRERVGDALGYGRKQPYRDVHLRFLSGQRRQQRRRWLGRLGRRHQCDLAQLAAHPTRSSSPPPRLTATASRSTPPAALSTPRSPCPATTPTSPRSR